MADLVSVLIPAFNCEVFIDEAIESIINQSYKNIQIVVVNDGSTDGTADKLSKYAKLDSRVIVLNKTNGGIVSALNYGLSFCEGKYIARMDADDISEKDRILTQVNFLDANPNVIICGSNITKFPFRSEVSSYPLTDSLCKAILFYDNCFAHPSVMFRKNILVDFNLKYCSGYDYAEDFKLWCDLAPYGNFSNIKKPLLRYRIHKGQCGSTKRETQIRSHCKIVMEKWKEKGVQLNYDDLVDVFFPEYAESYVSAVRSAAKFLKVVYVNFNAKIFILISVKIIKRFLVSRSAYL